jgi:hypothetical protein
LQSSLAQRERADAQRLVARQSGARTRQRAAATHTQRERRGNPPKRQIQAAGAVPPAFGQRVSVVVLQAAAHDQQAAVAQVVIEPFGHLRLSLRSNHEVTLCPERHARDHGIRTELGLVVGMEAHAVVAVPILIQEHAIESVPGARFDPTPQVVQPGRPCGGSECAARIRVIGVSVPSAEPRLVQLAAEELERCLLEADGAE